MRNLEIKQIGMPVGQVCMKGFSSLSVLPNF